MGKAIEVSDRPTEIWIKLLSFITTIAVGLVGVIGSMIITGQTKMTEEVSKINGNLQAYDSRISRNERDIYELEQLHINIRQSGE